MDVLSKRKTVFVILLSCLAFSLTGCIGQAPEEKMYTIMEAAVKQEKGFEEQQQPLAELEKKEQELYKQMISLGNQENEQVVKLADEALALVSKRKDHIEKEQESIQASKKKFEDLTPLISELKDEELKKQAIELNKTMKKRYEIHNNLSKQYLLGIQYDSELYEQLKAKDASLEKLEEQVTKINETYDKVLKTNDEFNAQTEKYNKEKLEFYKKANLNIPQ